MKSFGLGRLLYITWFKPLSFVQNSIKAGGPINECIDLFARRAMERSAHTLIMQTYALDQSLPPLHFLSGNKFWYQTAHCLYSLQAQAKRSFKVIVHDDGTFQEKTILLLSKIFPHLSVLRRKDTDAHLANLLPATKYPYLNDRRKFYPNILKLTDPHVGQTGWRLVLDSDMLFFREPTFLMNWLEHPDKPLHMIDIEDAYGYSPSLMSSLAGAPIPSKVNVGLIGMHSDHLDWELIESWCNKLISAEKTSYFLEQALVAMLVSSRSCAIAPSTDYVIMPCMDEACNPKAVMHHYVANSKRGYFRHAWKVALIS